jgi:hypothetical protein
MFSSCQPLSTALRRRTFLAVMPALLGFSSTAAAASAPAPTAAPGFTIHKLASAPKGATNCDDLAYLDGHLFMTCQNATLSTGGGGNSTIVEYAGDGTVLNTIRRAIRSRGLCTPEAAPTR